MLVFLANNLGTSLGSQGFNGLVIHLSQNLTYLLPIRTVLSRHIHGYLRVMPPNLETRSSHMNCSNFLLIFFPVYHNWMSFILSLNRAVSLVYKIKRIIKLGK